MALARPVSMTTPEWPPSSPSTLSTRAVPRAGTRRSGSRATHWAEPAQDTHITSGSPQSMLSILRAEIFEKSTWRIPTMPTSSPTVNSSSRGGWVTELSSMSASIFTSPTALSAPRVVPSA